MGLCTRSTHYGIFTAAAQEVSVDDGHWVKVVVDDIAECRSYIASRTCDADLLDVLNFAQGHGLRHFIFGHAVGVEAAGLGNRIGGKQRYLISPSAFIAACTAGRAPTRLRYASTLANVDRSTSVRAAQFDTVNR